MFFGKFPRRLDKAVSLAFASAADSTRLSASLLLPHLKYKSAIVILPPMHCTFGIAITPSDTVSAERFKPVFSAIPVRNTLNFIC